MGSKLSTFRRRVNLSAMSAAPLLHSPVDRGFGGGVPVRGAVKLKAHIEDPDDNCRTNKGEKQGLALYPPEAAAARRGDEKAAMRHGFPTGGVIRRFRGDDPAFRAVPVMQL